MRKGLLAPQNTFLDTIAERFDGSRKFLDFGSGSNQGWVRLGSGLGQARVRLGSGSGRVESGYGSGLDLGQF